MRGPVQLIEKPPAPHGPCEGPPERNSKSITLRRCDEAKTGGAAQPCDPPLDRRRLGPPDAGPIARKGKTDNRACRPFVDLRAERELSLIPFVSAAGGIREIDVGDHALVEQKEIRSHAVLAASSPPDDFLQSPLAFRRQCGNPSDDPGAALHRSEQLQSLSQIGRDQKVRSMAKGPKPVLPRRRVENGRHRCPRFDQLRRKEIEKRTRSRDHDLSARDEARCLEGNLGGSRGHDARKGPTRNREGALQGSRGEHHLPGLDETRHAIR